MTLFNKISPENFLSDDQEDKYRRSYLKEKHRYREPRYSEIIETKLFYETFSEGVKRHFRAASFISSGYVSMGLSSIFKIFGGSRYIQHMDIVSEAIKTDIPYKDSLYGFIKSNLGSMPGNAFKDFPKFSVGNSKLNAVLQTSGSTKIMSYHQLDFDDKSGLKKIGFNFVFDPDARDYKIEGLAIYFDGRNSGWKNVPSEAGCEENVVNPLIHILNDFVRGRVDSNNKVTSFISNMKVLEGHVLSYDLIKQSKFVPKVA